MVTNLRYWGFNNGFYISPAFPDNSSFGRAKRFFIRAGITIDCDERSRIIRIGIEGKANENNLKQLKKLHLVKS